MVPNDLARLWYILGKHDAWNVTIQTEVAAHYLFSETSEQNIVQSSLAYLITLKCFRTTLISFHFVLSLAALGEQEHPSLSTINRKN